MSELIYRSLWTTFQLGVFNLNNERTERFGYVFCQLSREKRKLILEAERNGFVASEFSLFSITLEKPGHDGLRLFINGKACNLLLLRTRVSNANIRTFKALRAFLELDEI